MPKSDKTSSRVLRQAFCVFLLLALTGLPAQAHNPDHPGVLFLHFGQKEAPYAIALRSAFIQAVQANTGQQVDYYIDSLDALEPGPEGSAEEHTRALVHVLRNRYARANIHLVVPISNEAIAFFKTYGREIFPEASAVYMALEFKKPPATPPLIDGTGAIVLFDAKATLDLALQQNPGTRHVVVIAGVAPYETLGLASARNDFLKYGDSLDIQYVTGVTYQELLTTVAKIRPQSVVLMLSFSRDAAGDEFIGSHVLTTVSAKAPAPIYVVYSTAVGLGAVGGMVHDFSEIGHVLGTQAAQVLTGTRAGDIPVQESTFQRPVFDWKQMQRWNLQEKTLPPNSILINQEFNVWSRYRWWIVGTVALLLAQLALIAGLLVARFTRRVAQQQLAYRMRHDQLVADLAAILTNNSDSSPMAGVEQGLLQLLQFYDLDRITLFEIDKEGKAFRFRYGKAKEEAEAAPRHVDLDSIRWEVDQLLKGKVVHASTLEDLPEEAQATRESLRRFKVRAFAAFPLRSATGVDGALSFVSLTRPVLWTPALLQQLQTISDLFSTALERSFAEEALRASEELSGTILDSLTSQLAVIDRQGRIVAVNKPWQDFWKANGGQDGAAPALGTNYLDTLHQSIATSPDADRALAGILAVMEGTVKLFQLEYQCHSPETQRWFQMYVSPLLHTSGAVIRHLDITARKLAELQLRESEARFRVIADSAPVMIWLAGADKLCTYFNTGWLEFTGRPLVSELGNGWLENVHPNDLERCVRGYEESFDARRPFTMEYRLRRHDGQYRWVLDNGVPRSLSDGTFAGYIGGCVDVSEQKESEEARSHLSGLLIGAQEQERARIARELHDHINQRLALLAIDLQQFEQSATGLPEEKKAELEQLWELTNDISRDVQALSHQLHSSQLQHLGLVAAVRGLCQEFSRSGSIQAEFASQGVPLKLDENISLALFRVTQEALRNVSKYSHARTANVELVCNRNEVSLTIRDDGIGFVPEDISSNGLGLISMRERMRLVGGDLSVVSAPGQGTRIGAHLRLVSAPDVAEQPATAAKVDRRKRMRA